MKLLFIIIITIAIFAWYSSSMKKIDRDEAKALQTPGTAVFLRNNFGDFIDEILNNQDNYIEFERSDQIRFSKKTNSKKLIIGNYMASGGPIMNVVVVENDRVITEMKFKKGTNSAEIAKKILPLFT